MRRRWVKLFVFGGCSLLWGTFCWGQELGPEPVYGDRTLSQWLIVYGGLDSKVRVNDAPVPVDSVEKERARRAVREIGSNAVPFLLEWRGGARPPSGEGVKRWDSAWLLGFEILRTNGSAAIPELSRAAIGGGTNYEAWNAILALRFLGKDALPPLLGVVTNRAFVDGRRGHAAICIGTMRRLGFDVRAAVPVLIGCLKDCEVAEDAANALGDLALTPEVSVPALIQALHQRDERVRWSAAAALGEFGPKAESAVPALKEALDDHEELVRRCASKALEKIQAGVPKVGEPMHEQGKVRGRRC